MRAIVQDRYGSPDVIFQREIDRPAIDDDTVLVRVRAASVNAVDWHMMRGEPFPARFGNGLRRPKVAIRGVDVAGVVASVGRRVIRFGPGDVVFGSRVGAFAEFVAGRERNFVMKPASLTFEQAAAVPLAAQTALQGLRDRGRILPGHRVLINGAAGGVGTFAVQVAKALGAHVTGVCSTRNVELVRSIGADRVIDYTREDFTRSIQRYDLLFDIAGSRPLRTCRRVLANDGTLVVVGGPGGRWVSPIGRSVRAVLLSRFGPGRLVPFLAAHLNEDLETVRDLIEAGQVTPVVDRTFALEETADAIRYVETGHARGKVVITI